MTNALSAWVLGSAVALILAGCGHAVLKLLRVAGLRPEARFAVSLGIGAGLYSYLFFALGHAGVINTAIYWAIFGAGLALAIPALRAFLRDCRGLAFRWPAAEPRWLYRWMLIVLVLCAVLSFISSAAPVSDWDCRQYHLGAVKDYLSDGIVRFHDDDVMHNLYIGQSMLALWIMKIGSDSACQVLTWWFGAGLLCATHALGRRLFTPAAALTATALVAAFGFFAERSIQPAPDMAATMMSVLVIYLLVEMRDRAGPAALAVMGLLAGVSVAFRMNSVLFLVPTALFAVIWWRRLCGMRWRRIAGLAVVGSLCCLLFWLPWPVRNYVWTGNPVYPFMYQTFGGWMWNDRSEQSGAATWVVTHGGLLGQATDWVTTPLKFIRFGGLALALAPLALVFRGRRKECGLLMLTLLVAIVVVGRFARSIDRYYAAAMPLAAVLAGYALVRLLEWRGGFRRALPVVVSVALLADVGASGIWHQQFVRAALGLSPRDVFLRNSTGFYDDFVWMNENLPPDSKVLVIFREDYYLERAAVRFTVPCTPQIGLFDFGNYDNSADFARALHQAEVTHLFFPDPENPAMSQFWNARCWSAEGLRLFADLRAQHAALVRHNEHGWYCGRLHTRDIVSTWLYRLIPPEYSTIPVEGGAGPASARRDDDRA